MKLKTFFAWILGVFVVMLLVVQAAAVVTRLLLDDYRCAVAKHQELVSLSNELQQSSDELHGCSSELREYVRFEVGGDL